MLRHPPATHAIRQLGVSRGNSTCELKEGTEGVPRFFVPREPAANGPWVRYCAAMLAWTGIGLGTMKPAMKSETGSKMVATVAL
jgi:hypothetical protein